MMLMLLASPLKLRYLISMAFWVGCYCSLNMDGTLSFGTFIKLYRSVERPLWCRISIGAITNGYGKRRLVWCWLGHSMQNFYLPESHTDFIFAVLVEELGGITALIMLFLYGLIITRLISLRKLCIRTMHCLQAILCLVGHNGFFCKWSSIQAVL